MKEQFRRHIEKISPLSDEKFDYVFSFFKSKKIRKNSIIISSGDLVFHEYWVFKGCLKASYMLEDGKERIIRFAVEDWWVSDYDAYFKNAPATLSIESLEDCDFLVLSLNDREKLCNELPEMNYFFRKKIEAAYSAFQRRLVSMLSNDAKKHYEIFVNQYPMLMERLPKSIIASYLGITRETLSRISNAPM
ncbi:Crp/Fnr family transcriptional regulator [Flavobacterium sp. SH_e]|uniref:Crp/Fnr family transcriptional regulator n=1 Tax=Flavobacterium TaxID=237 RepID=UPI0021E446BD|nr:Crp/Fnr family transcriptional regulator [Flavobacterium sp. SH_e]MCV2484662.1 Crp/Fnr family transcriptional regulator [Flavobacterium sp. SH_e]